MPDAMPSIHWTAWVTMALLATVLGIAAITDLRSQIVHNRLTYPAMALGLIWAAVAGGITAGGGGAVTGLLASFIAMLVAIIPFAIIFAAGGFGGGDVKLMGAVGAISASWQCVLATTLYALVLGAVLAIIVMVRCGLVRRTMGRLFGAAMMAAARVKPDIPQDSPRIPFALAIAIGGIVAGVENVLGVAGVEWLIG